MTLNFDQSASAAKTRRTAHPRRSQLARPRLSLRRRRTDLPGSRRRPLRLGRRRQSLHRLCRLLGAADSRPRRARRRSTPSCMPPETAPASALRHRREADLAELVTEAFPAVEKVRFVSSGTEATMCAIRLARALHRPQIHRQVRGLLPRPYRSLLVKAGSGVATLGIPGSAGVPEEFVAVHAGAALQRSRRRWKRRSRKFKDKIACVIVEPVVGNMGCVPPKPGYLEGLRAITAARRCAAHPR